MRNLFICFLLATVAYLVQQGPDPVFEPATYLGILVVFPILGARLFRNWHLPPAVGALAAGAVLAQSGLLDTSTLESVGSFRDAAFIWLGLYTGSRIPRVPTFRATNLAVAGAIVVSCSLLICIGTFYLDLTLLERLQIGLIGAACAPVFILLEPDHHRDEIGLTGLTAVAAILLIGITMLGQFREMEMMTPSSLATAGLGLVALAIGSELVFRALKTATSGPGRYMVLIVTMGVLWRLSGDTSIHPALMGCALGILCGLRTKSRQDLLQPLSDASTFAAAFVLGFLSAETNWGRLVHAPQIAWILAVSLVVPMTIGKAVSGRIASKLTNVRPHRWIRTFPVGIVAFVALPALLPDRIFLGSITHSQERFLPALFLGAICLPLTGSLLEKLSDYVASRR